VLTVLAACGGGQLKPAIKPPAPDRAATAADRILPLLPDGAQVVVELDLARLRANAVVGGVARQALGQLGADARLPGLPVAAQGSPFANADLVILAAYGVGTPQAATLTVLVTHTDVPGATRLASDAVALGPDDWVGQLQTRATVGAIRPDAPLAAHEQSLIAPVELLHLRDHAMPAGATGAVVRVTARLPFDARVAFARETGLETAPAQLSVWCDVADDLAIVVDADAADPGDRAAKDSTRRLVATIRAALALVADQSTVRALGVPNSISDARVIAQGTWVRAIIAIGPRHLARAVERARAMLGPTS
jgi:hypothetical protein